jgi:hypothetical protein
LAFNNFVLFDRVHLPIIGRRAGRGRGGLLSVRSAALLRVIHPELIEISLMRSHSSGLAGKGIVIPACAPIVPRIIVWVRLVVGGDDIRRCGRSIHCWNGIPVRRRWLRG